jgi:hypothetical protein
VAEQGEAVHARHHHVQQHQVGNVLAGHRQRLVAIAGDDRFVPVAREQGADHAQVRRLVVDDKDPARSHHRRGHALSIVPCAPIR